MRYLIYGLVDPDSLLVRYIGKSSSGLNRPRAHKAPSQLRDRTWRANWILQLCSRGQDYGIAILQHVDRGQLAEAERWWIAYGRVCGWPLTNLTTGGDGTPGWVMPDSVKQKISASKMDLVSRGVHHWQSLDHAVAVRGRMLSGGSPAKRPEVAAKISAALTGHRHGADTRGRMAAAASRRWNTPEATAFMRSDANPARKPGAAAKIRDSRIRQTVGKRLACWLAGVMIPHYVGAPLGFRTRDGVLVEDPDEQSVITEILRLRGTGLALKAIVRSMRDRGFKLRSTMSYGQVQRILAHRNRVRR